jgi:hypothetical protein
VNVSDQFSVIINIFIRTWVRIHYNCVQSVTWSQN